MIQLKENLLAGKLIEKDDKTVEGGSKKIPCVVIETLVHGTLICGAMQIVDTFMGKIPEGTPVYIECLHAKQGEMKQFRIVNLS